MSTIFRDYSHGDALRSDRSASDRQRHRKKIRSSLQENIADVIAEESIIGQNREKVIKVPIRGIKEYRFVYGDNSGGAAQGDGESQPGQVVGQDGQPGDQPGPAGDQPGVDFYETDITLSELIDIMFEDLELPELERKNLKDITTDSASRRRGYRSVGVKVHLDKRRSVRQKVRRKVALQRIAEGQESLANIDDDSFPFRKEDLRYRRRVPTERPSSNAAIVCIMDTSGSMDSMKKYLARSFFFMLYQFVRTKYENVEIAFIAHHTQGKEVTEEEFFHKGESGGTMISSGYKKALEVIHDRYHPEMWNVYAFHCSDGDNLSFDNPIAVQAAEELCDLCNLFGYGEIKPASSYYPGSTMLDVFDEIARDNFKALSMKSKEDIWPVFREFMSSEKSIETH